MTREIDILRRRLHRAEAALEAIRTEQADAVLGEGRVVLLRLQETEQALRQSEERLRMAMEAGKLASWEIDPATGKIMTCPRLNRMLDLPYSDKQQDRDQYLAMVLGEDRDRLRAAEEHALENGRRYEVEYRVRRPDGEIRWLRNQGLPIQDEQGNVVKLIGNVADITRTKQIEDKLRYAIAERDKFFSIIAHDLRSPFIGFLNFIRILNDRFKKISLGEIQRLTKDMRYSAESLYNLLENLLEWSLVQRGVSKFSPAVCSLTELARENVQLVQSCSAQKNIEIKCLVPDDLRVYVDRAMIKMVLRNLLSNAVKFSFHNSRVTITAEQIGCMVQVCVEDKGVGMDDGILEKLFFLDKMSSRKGTSGEKGTGLGLLLCREYIVKHGGDIWAHSSPQQGTEFYFTLPTKKTKSSVFE